jgi:hypothetical protein
VKHWPADAWLAAAIILYYAIVGLVVLRPEAVYSGDIGVKYVQAQALVDHRFRSLDIGYPGGFLDPDRRFFPLRPPFVMNVGAAPQAIFPPASTVIEAIGVAVAGFRGMIIVTLIGGAVTILAVRAIAPARDRFLAVLAIGLASPLWFYAISGWEHAPAVGLGVLGFAITLRSPSRWSPFLAGVAVGVGATIRDEVVLLAPGLALATWMRTRRWQAVAETAGGVFVPLVSAMGLEVWWFGRPPAAHMRHAVHVLQTALSVTTEPNPDVPVLQPITPQERYAYVVQYWIFGYDKDRWIWTFVAAGAIAFGLRALTGSSIPLAIWLGAVLVPALVDFQELMRAPKWLAGLQRVVPYAVCALLPRPRGNSDDDQDVPFIAAMTTAAYLIVAYVGTDTHGGKSLGPRLLLPLVPLLVVAAVIRIHSYVRSAGVAERATGYIGAALLGLSLLMHVFGTLPAYHRRNEQDAGALIALAASPVRVIVADDDATAQLLLPLYRRKVIFLADTPALMTSLGASMVEQRIPEVVVVSRQSQPAALEGLHIDHLEKRGRMLLQYYRR